MKIIIEIEAILRPGQELPDWGELSHTVLANVQPMRDFGVLGQSCTIRADLTEEEINGNDSRTDS